MAFWRKSEDPWDMEPRPVGTVSPVTPDRDEEPETLADSLKAWNEARKEKKARREEPLPPMTCPWCGKEMETGYLMGNRGIWWAPGRPGTWAKWVSAAAAEGAVQVDTEGALFTYQTAWACQGCRRLVTDLPEPAPHLMEGEQREAEENAQVRRQAEQAKQG